MEKKTAIPDFRPDGYLPEGLHVASEAEILFRFGASTKRRRRLALRLRRWIELARTVGATRFLVDGSFVTAKPEPHDVDAVVLIPTDFENQIGMLNEAALELDEMLMRRQPEEIFAAEDENDWQDWVEFFLRTREPNGRRKGLVEVML
ncbi:MAG: hypothetical protein WD065_01875 [Planctomycetaceae bacterium]